MGRAISGYRLDPEKRVFLGYSNGANFLAAAMLLQPSLAGKAILLRPSMVLETPPAIDLSSSQILIVEGRDDPHASRLPGLMTVLSANRATVSAVTVPAGHELDDDDLRVVRASAASWLS